MDVVGGGEEDADDVVVNHAIALAHRLEQLDGAGMDVLLFIRIDGGGAPEGTDSGRHGG